MSSVRRAGRRRLGGYAAIAAAAMVGGVLAAGRVGAAPTGTQAAAAATQVCPTPRFDEVAAACMPVIAPSGSVLPGADPNGYTPAELRSAYALPSGRGS